jgi:hypothetical protein
MPASNNRDRQPVYGLAEGLGQALEIPVFTNILHKTKNGTSLKDLQTREEKESVLVDSFLFMMVFGMMDVGMFCL